MTYAAQNMPDHVLAPELTGGERLLWSGRPRQGLFFQRGDAYQIPFSVLWFGFACVWESMAIKSGNMFMIIWGVPFVAIGLYMFAGRFLWDEWVRGRTYYGLTDRRAIIVQMGWRRNVRSVDYSSMGEISYSEGPDNRGSVTFGPEASTFRWVGDHQSRQPQSPRFVQIEGGRDVYHRILRLKEEVR